MRADVFCGERRVGTLDDAEPDRFVFSYLPDTQPDDLISLSMPVRAQPYRSRVLHPVFQMSLPEERLRSCIESRLARRPGRAGDLEILIALGATGVGRVRLVAPGDAVRPAAAGALDALLQGTADALLQWYLAHAVVAQAHPAGRSSASAVRAEDGTLEGIRTAHWIIRHDQAKAPTLAFNTHWTMEVLRLAGIPTVPTRLSDDLHAIAIGRSESAGARTPRAAEDFCSLLNRPAHEKYMGTVEKMVQVLRDFVPVESLANDLARFFAVYLAASVLRDGDAHLKKFGLLYTSVRDVRLAPVADLAATSVYAPAQSDGDAHDTLALTFAGTKRWLNQDALASLSVLCGLERRGRDAILEKLARAVAQVSVNLEVVVARHASFAPDAQRMRELWSHGLRVFSPSASRFVADVATRLGAQAPLRGQNGQS